MWIRNLFDSLKPWHSRTPVQKAWREKSRRRPAASRLTVDALEDRCVPASLSVGDVAIMEGVSGTQNAALIVTLSAPSTKTVTVNYNTAYGTAIAGSDYDAVSGNLTFAPGETSKSILVPVRGDRLTELDGEYVVVSLSRAKNATIADGSGVVTIQDSSPRIGFSDARAWVSEPDGSGRVFATFTVSLSAAYDETVTVKYGTQDGILWGNGDQYDAAHAGQDYVATSGTLTFAPGERTKTISVEILGDGVFEYDEWFGVDIFSASANALVHQGNQTGGLTGVVVISGEFGTPPW
jgi:chitinase